MVPGFVEVSHLRLILYHVYVALPSVSDIGTDEVPPKKPGEPHWSVDRFLLTLMPSVANDCGAMCGER